MKTTIKWNADLFGVEIQTEDEHFVISAQPSMAMTWHDAVRYFQGNAGWKLPTKDQLKIVSAYISTINDLIKENGGYEIRGLVWTDESNEIYARGVRMYDGSTDDDPKYHYNYVRAVSDLTN